MDYRRAYELYLANRDKYAGIPPAQAVSQIQRSGGMEAYAPQGAVPAAVPVPQGAIAAAIPVPKPQVEAVPVTEGEVVAEQPPAPRPYRGAYAQALEAFNAENPVVEQQAPPKGGKVDFVAMAKQRAVEARRADLMAKARIEEQAEIDPELKKLYDERIQRTTQELENVDKDRNQAVWMAIAQAGMKMAQSQSPYFMQALASGLESGLNGYSEAKAKAAEKKARLQAMKEDLTIETVQAKRQAQAEAVARYDSSMQNAAAAEALEKAGLQNIILGETAGEEIAGSKLANDVRRAQIAQIYSNIENDKARLALARTAGRGGGGGGGRGSSGRSPIPNYEIKNETDSEGRERQVLVPKSSGAVSLVEGPYGEWMPKRYADNPAALADAKRAAHKAGAVGYEFSPGGDMLAILPDGRRAAVRHFRRR